MMRATRTRIGSPAWLGLALVLAVPALAEAQLFPNRTITRERPACAAEPPFNKIVRQNYFGYYPTCWNRFPAGWQCPCPNPELPNAAASFAERARDKPSPLPVEEGMDGAMPGEDAGPVTDPRPGDGQGMPALPNSGRSPFNSDPSAPEGTPDRAPRGSAVPPQTSRTPAPSPGTAPRPSTTSTLPVPSPTPPATTTGLLEMPRVLPPVAAASPTEPALDPGMIALAPDATLASTAGMDRPNLGPLPSPATPDATTPMGIDPALLAQNQPGAPTGTAAPVQAPQRKGLLSGLFSSSKKRR